MDAGAFNEVNIILIESEWSAHGSMEAKDVAGELQ